MSEWFEKRGKMKRKLQKIVILLAMFVFLFGYKHGLVYSVDFEETNLQFKLDNDFLSTDPVHPLRPSKKIELYPRIIDQMPGPLSLDVTPFFQFDEQAISSSDQIYNASLQQFLTDKGERKEIPNYLQVTDKSGRQNGWRLTLLQASPFQTLDGKHELRGAHLTLSHIQGASTVADSYAPNIVDEVSLAPGITTILAEASQGQGMGTWVIRFGGTTKEAQSAIQLFVPGRSVKRAKTYQARLNWKLSDVPVNGEE